MDKRRARPIGDRVIVRRHEKRDRVGAIWVPASAQDVPRTGRVMAIGDDVRDVAVGDFILFSAYSGREVEIADCAIWVERDEALMVMRESEILAIIEPGARADGVHPEWVPSEDEVASAFSGDEGGE